MLWSVGEAQGDPFARHRTRLRLVLSYVPPARSCHTHIVHCRLKCIPCTPSQVGIGHSCDNSIDHNDIVVEDTD